RQVLSLPKQRNVILYVTLASCRQSQLRDAREQQCEAESILCKPRYNLSLKICGKVAMKGCKSARIRQTLQIPSARSKPSALGKVTHTKNTICPRATVGLTISSRGGESRKR